MSDFLTSFVVGASFVVLALTIVLGVYFMARRLIHPGTDGDRTHDAAGTIAFRIAALHGLILALVYAQELDDYKGVRTTLTDEAVAISDVYNDIQRYGGPAIAPVQSGLASYVATVVNEEWARLGRRQGLSATAWVEWDAVYGQLLDLEPATDRQRFLADRMRHRVTEIARFREIRETTAMGGFSTLFWAPALIGLALLSLPFYVYRPTRSHVILLSIFGVYSGIILFFIYAFSNPFAQPGRLDPAPFEHLLQGDVGKGLSTE